MIRTESNLLFFQVPKEKDRPESVRCEGTEKGSQVLCFALGRQGQCMSGASGLGFASLNFASFSS